MDLTKFVQPCTLFTNFYAWHCALKKKKLISFKKNCIKQLEMHLQEFQAVAVKIYEIFLLLFLLFICFCTQIMNSIQYHIQ